MHFLHDFPQSIHVGAKIHRCALHPLFGSHIIAITCRNFQDGKVGAIAQPEINHFHILPIAGEHNVVGLEVAVHHLLLGAAFECLNNFPHDFKAHFHLGGIMSGKIFLQGDAVHIFLHNAIIAHFRHIFPTHIFHDGGVIEAAPDFKFFPQGLPKHRHPGIFGSQGFERPPLMVALCLQ